MSSKLNLVWPGLCFAVGTLLGTSVKGTGTLLPAGPIIEQTAYYAKPGLAEEVYQHRVHASNVRQTIGLPRGQVLRRVGGTGDLPDVIWQLAYADRDALQRDLDSRAKSPAFEEVRVTMNTLVANFSRGFYEAEAR